MVHCSAVLADYWLESQLNTKSFKNLWLLLSKSVISKDAKCYSTPPVDRRFLYWKKPKERGSFYPCLMEGIVIRSQYVWLASNFAYSFEVRVYLLPCFYLPVAAYYIHYPCVKVYAVIGVPLCRALCSVPILLLCHDMWRRVSLNYMLRSKIKAIYVLIVPSER